MGKKDPRIDAYIENAQSFAKPVLKHFRKLVHKHCPEVEEKWKWSFPHFDYGGGPLAHMAAFKNHCGVGFWKVSLLKKNKNLSEFFDHDSAMSSFGKITSRDDLPEDKKLIDIIHEAMKLNNMGIKVSAKPVSKNAIEIPDYFLKALKKNKAALETYEKLSNSNKKDYVTWVAGAKTEATRKRRLETAVEWMSEGKIRNWKYVK